MPRPPRRRYERWMQDTPDRVAGRCRQGQCGGRAIALLLALLLDPGSGMATEPRHAHTDPNPDATIEIEEVRVGLLVLGGTLGGGRLHFHGRAYAFTVRGLDLGSVGIASLSARGEVFGLHRLEDFPGRYVEESMPQPPGGDAGPDPIRLRNAAGVVMRLRSERAGGVLRVVATGLDIEFRQ